MKKLYLFFAFLFTALVLTSCSYQKEYSLTSEEIATQFVDIWLAEYEQIKSISMTLPEGKAFLADLTGDNLPELFFLYSNYKNSGVYIYNISDKEIKVIGDFTTSLYDNEDIIFKIYGGKNKKVLHTQEILYGSFTDNRNFVKDVFVKAENGTLTVNELSMIKYQDETSTEYYSSPQSNVKITKQEYDKKIDEYTNDLKLNETIILSPNEQICKFDNNENLKKYILNLLN